MSILNTISLECNKKCNCSACSEGSSSCVVKNRPFSSPLNCYQKIKINFNGGDLFSDAGLILIKSFAEKIGLIGLVRNLFKANDPAVRRFHLDPDNLLQLIYQIIDSNFEDDCADELTNDPVFTAILEKRACFATNPVTRLESDGPRHPGIVQSD